MAERSLVGTDAGVPGIFQAVLFMMEDIFKAAAQT